MKRWLSHLMIVAYLSTLGFGITCHTFNYKTGSHPGMYFIVWDMFCGWSAYSSRWHIFGEGESGKHYELAPGPWGEFRPFGRIGRRHYDAFGNFCNKLAMNTLKQTNHEPMTRIFVVEECWPKKFNLPENIWQKRFDESKDIQKYYQLRYVVATDGTVLQSYPEWLSRQSMLSVLDNPRLKNDTRKNQSYYTVKSKKRASSSYEFDNPSGKSRFGSPLGL